MTVITAPRDRRRRRLIVACASSAAVVVFTAASCSNDEPANTPTPGATVTGQSDVRAPNGADMGSTPINMGTPGAGGG